MRKSGTLFFAALLTLAFFHTDAFAKDEKADKEAVAAVPKRSAADEKKIAEQRKRTQAARTDLNGSSWEVTLRPLESKGKDVKDKFTFQDGMFKSEHYGSRGFTPTNYSITMSGEETEQAIWETMLTAKEGQIFIRGEWEKDKMRGNITEQLDGGKKVVERYFTTEARKAIPPSSKKEESAKEEAIAGAVETGSRLVSKEEAPIVTPFKPGTTDETR